MISKVILFDHCVKVKYSNYQKWMEEVLYIIGGTVGISTSAEKCSTDQGSFDDLWRYLEGKKHACVWAEHGDTSGGAAGDQSRGAVQQDSMWKRPELSSISVV